MNIVQDEECEAFHRFITQLAQRVASENPGVDALIESKAKGAKKKAGLVISIVFFLKYIF